MTEKILVLIEDSPADARVVSRAVERIGDDAIKIIHHDTAEKAIRYFTEDSARHPDRKRIVLMDLNLPGVDGFSLLKHVKNTPALKHIPVIVWTTSDQPSDIKESYETGANSFVVKPMGLRDVTKLVEELCHYWFDRATLA